jgi:toxin ParE1/3/4
MTTSRHPSPVQWTRRARRDLRGIGDFIARDKPDAATQWVGRILASVDRIATFPGSGRVVPEGGRDDIREVILEAYRIVYLVREHNITILTVFEGHKLLPRGVLKDTDAKK